MKYSVLAFLLLVGNLAHAQSFEGTVKHQGRQQPAAVLEVPYSNDIVMAAMANYLSKKRKSAETDIPGFATFRNSQMPDTGENADLYFRVERKTRHEKDISVVYLLLTTLNEAQIPRDTLHYLNMKDARAHLDDLALVITAYDLEKQVSSLYDEIHFMESVYGNLDDDRKQIETEQKTLNGKFARNAEALQDKRVEIDAHKRKLAELTGQRK